MGWHSGLSVLTGGSREGEGLCGGLTTGLTGAQGAAGRLGSCGSGGGAWPGCVPMSDRRREGR
jgi:hypothetical protein